MKGFISISFKVIMFLLGSIILMMLIFSFIYLVYSRNFLIGQMKNNSNNIADIVFRNLIDDFNNQSNKLGDNIITEMEENDNIICIIIKADDDIITGKIRNKKWITDIKENDVTLDDVLKLERSASLVRHSFNRENKTVSMEIYFSYKTIIDTQMDQLVLIMIQTALISLLIIIILFLLLNKIIIKPLMLLKNAFVYLSNKNFIYSSETLAKTNDEIGELSMAFNNMAKELNTNHENNEALLTDLNTEINERKKSEENLNFTKNYLKTILNSLSSMIFSTDKEGSIIEINRCAEVFLNSNLQEIQKQKIWDVLPFLSTYKQEILDALEKSSDMMIRGLPCEKPEKKFFDVFIQPFTFDILNGAVIRIDDITELENKKLQLLQSQKMEMIGTLSGGIAHDFNNILSAILGTMSIIRYREKLEENIDKATMDNYLNIIETASNRAKNLINRILTISKKNEHNFESVDLSKIINGVLCFLGNTFDKCINVTVNMKDKNTFIYGDFVQIEQVLLNICVNAYHSMTIMHDSTEKWGGTLDITMKKINADKKFIDQHQDSFDGEYWQISITDNGVGIKEDDLSKIFEPFYSTKNKDQGTGLGLSIVYRVIKDHKGFITVNSEPGNGTCFKIYLPVLDKTITNEHTNKKTIHYGKGKILFIDDEEMVRHIGAAMLSQCGYEVIKASDAEEGLDIYTKQFGEIDMVVLDMIMPKISGNQLFLKMKQINPDIKVILSSGFRKDERVEDTLKLGALGFIQKPFSIEELSKKAYEILNKTAIDEI